MRAEYLSLEFLGLSFATYVCYIFIFIYIYFVVCIYVCLVIIVVATNLQFANNVKT